MTEPLFKKNPDYPHGQYDRIVLKECNCKSCEKNRMEYPSLEEIDISSHIFIVSGGKIIHRPKPKEDNDRDNKQHSQGPSEDCGTGEETSKE